VPRPGGLGAPAGPPAAAVARQPEDGLAEAPADARAEAALDGALRALAEHRVRWLQADVWQQVDLPGFAYEANGRYLMGPGHRFRLEVRTTVKAGGPGPAGPPGEGRGPRGRAGRAARAAP